MGLRLKTLLSSLDFEYSLALKIQTTSCARPAAGGQSPQQAGLSMPSLPGLSPSAGFLAEWDARQSGQTLDFSFSGEAPRGAATHSRREAVLGAEAPTAGLPLALLGHAACAHVGESLHLVASGHSTDPKPWPQGQTQAPSEADCGAPAPQEGDRHVPSEANTPAKH